MNTNKQEWLCNFLKFCFCLCFTVVVVTPHAMADDLPLSSILTPMTGADWSAVQSAAATATINGPHYGNIPGNLPEYKSFDGTFTPDIGTTALAIHSDDGCDVFVDGVKVWAGKDQGQDFATLSQSLHQIPLTNPLKAGHAYHLHIDYSNTIYTGNLDIDGATLYAYADNPIVKVNITNQQTVPSFTVQELTADLSANVSNAPQTTPDCAVDLPVWQWNFSNLRYSEDGINWGDPPVGSSYALGIYQADPNSPQAKLDARFYDVGYWAVDVTATVTYHTTCGNIASSDTDGVGVLDDGTVAEPNGLVDNPPPPPATMDDLSSVPESERDAASSSANPIGQSRANIRPLENNFSNAHPLSTKILPQTSSTPPAESPKPAKRIPIAVPLAPPGVSVNKNIEIAQAYNGFDARQHWFYNKVRNNHDRHLPLTGPNESWDYKQIGSQYDDFGNFNFGATGRATGCFSRLFLHRMAGKAQIDAHTSKPEWGTPGNIYDPSATGTGPYYGDDPQDYKQIEAGMDYYDKKLWYHHYHFPGGW